MTLLVPADPVWRSPSDLELTGQQLRAVTAFNAARAAAERLGTVATRSRELRLDAARRQEVLRREHDALVARAHEQLRATGEPVAGSTRRRVVLAHGSAWWRDTIAGVLSLQGVRVVAETDNGADAIGISVAEQPDLVLVEDCVSMVAGDDVVREIRRYSPQSLIAALVAHSDRVATYLEAGATSAFTRQVPPADVARAMLGLVERRRHVRV